MKSFLTRKTGRSLAFILVFFIIYTAQLSPVHADQKGKKLHNNSSITLEQDITSGDLEHFTDSFGFATTIISLDSNTKPNRNKAYRIKHTE